MSASNKTLTECGTTSHINTSTYCTFAFGN